MVDKLDLRIPPDARFTPEFAHLYAETAGDPKYWHPSEHYTQTADLRPFGFEAVLHLGRKWQSATGKGHPHKLELIDTGQSTLSSWIAEIERVFELPFATKNSRCAKWKEQGPERLELIRLDLAADVSGVPVDWFRTHMRVLWKRRCAEIGKYMVISQGEGETIYYGKRPNCFRVYNKTAELKEQHKRLTRKVSPDSEIPSFEETYRVSPDALITRVERQFGGGRLPDQIRTVQQLRALSGFDPFPSVEIVARGSAPAIRGSGNCVLSLAGEMVQQLVREHGLQRARQLIALRDPHNASRTLARLAPFFALDSETDGITRETLVESYRQSVAKQLAA